MSGVKVVSYLLANNAPVVVQVPVARIISATTLPLKVVMPAISVRKVSGVERAKVNMAEGDRFQVDRIQVTARAASYATKEAILTLVRTALADRRGTVNGVWVNSILPEAEGPDLDEIDASIFERGQDFIVTWGVPPA
jgi:hypothetical protein